MKICEGGEGHFLLYVLRRFVLRILLGTLHESIRPFAENPFFLIHIVSPHQHLGVHSCWDDPDLMSWTPVCLIFEPFLVKRYPFNLLAVATPNFKRPKYESATVIFIDTLILALIFIFIYSIILLNAPPPLIRRHSSPLVFMPTYSLPPPPKLLLARRAVHFLISIECMFLLYFAAKYQLMPAFLLHYIYCRCIHNAIERLGLMVWQDGRVQSTAKPRST